MSLSEAQGKITSSNYLLIFFSSLYLFKLGLAPQIQDLYGKVDFTGKKKKKPKRGDVCAAFMSYSPRHCIDQLKDCYC